MRGCNNIVGFVMVGINWNTLYRLSEYDSAVQLGARVGAKIRERDEQEKGSLQRNKVG